MQARIFIISSQLHISGLKDVEKAFKKAVASGGGDNDG
jgi:hypothetical protein